MAGAMITNIAASLMEEGSKGFNLEGIGVMKKNCEFCFFVGVFVIWVGSVDGLLATSNCNSNECESNNCIMACGEFDAKFF